jgi:hypothetical protein
MSIHSAASGPRDFKGITADFTRFDPKPNPPKKPQKIRYND